MVLTQRASNGFLSPARKTSENGELGAGRIDWWNGHLDFCSLFIRTTTFTLLSIKTGRLLMTNNSFAQRIQHHRLKCWPEYFQALKMGLKTFELRKDDRNFQVGDILVLEEYLPDEGRYTGDELRFSVTYKLSNFVGIEPGYCVLGVHPFESSL